MTQFCPVMLIREDILVQQNRVKETSLNRAKSVEVDTINYTDWDVGETVPDANLPIVCQSHVPHWTRSNVRDWTWSHVGHSAKLVQS